MDLAREPRIVVLAAALIFCVACETTDEKLFDQVGVAQLLIVDSALAGQALADDPTVQAAEWDLTQAILEFGDVEVDLLGGEPCDIKDTARLPPVAVGLCAGGIVLPATDDLDVRIRLVVETMRVRRAEPKDLGALDYDGDGVRNDGGDPGGSPFDNPCGLVSPSVDCDDNCPIQPNPDQADSNGDGTGDACEVFSFLTGDLERDSDGDGVPDFSDNCVWEDNPGQQDTTGLTAEAGLADGIGNACNEQVAVVANLPGEFILPLQLDQPLRNTAILTVDFNNARTFPGTSCDWSSETCLIVASAVSACGRSALAFGNLSCPPN